MKQFNLFDLKKFILLNEMKYLHIIKLFKLNLKF